MYGNLFVKKQEFSEQENRYLAKAPTFTFEKLVNGDYAKQWEEYINDHFIFRNKWVELKSMVEIFTRKDRNKWNIYRERWILVSKRSTKL